VTDDGLVAPDRFAELLAPWLGHGPAYAAVAAGVRGLVLDGRLPAGSRVPSERTLSGALGVSRTTVSAAYDVLRAQGYLHSASGAGTRVALPRAASARPDADPGEPAVVRDLTIAALAAPAQLLDAVRGATEDLAPLLADHGLHPYGLPALRAAIADHLTGRGLATGPQEVLVTSGALHGWNLLLRTLARPGHRVLVEQPTYPAVLDAVRAQHLRPVALPVSATGWELPPPGAVLAHVTPDGQNPTGLLADAEQRRALLAAVDAPVVAVDETFADLVLDGAPPPPLASLDTCSRVVTLGSMGKSFWAGLRVGWVRAAPDLLARLAQARASLDLTSPVLDQLVAARLLAQAPVVLAERRAALRRSREALLGALARRLPDWRVVPPRAGLVLWVQMPAPGATRVAAHALDLGLRLAPGPRFTLDGTADRWLRLPYTLPPEEADAVVAVLHEARARTLASTPTTRTPARWTA
jgi:DNA-binding transcriptional MocR family regulator